MATTLVNGLTVSVSNIGIQGRPGLVFRGTYNALTQYYQGDVVHLSGSSYVAERATVGNAPVNTTVTADDLNWEVISLKGTDATLYLTLFAYTKTAASIAPATPTTAEISDSSSTDDEIVPTPNAAITWATVPPTTTGTERGWVSHRLFTKAIGEATFTASGSTWSVPGHHSGVRGTQGVQGVGIASAAVSTAVVDSTTGNNNYDITITYANPDPDSAVVPVPSVLPISAPRGNSVLNGVIPPTAAIGIDGDFYLDTASTNVNFYGPKVVATAGNNFGWGTGTPLLGITPAQALAITANTAKIGITPVQTQAILDNSVKTGITTGQADEITANTLKVGITTSQAGEITANTLKIGITPTESSSILLNNDKVGITPAQRDAILANTSAHASKTGITQVQADAIAANTLKTGITSSQAADLAANTLARGSGLTDAQKLELAANTAKTGYTDTLARKAISAEPNGHLEYTESTGVFKITALSLHDTRVYTSKALRNADVTTVWNRGDVAVITATVDKATYIFSSPNQTTKTVTTDSDWILLTSADADAITNGLAITANTKLIGDNKTASETASATNVTDIAANTRAISDLSASTASGVTSGFSGDSDVSAGTIVPDKYHGQLIRSVSLNAGKLEISVAAAAILSMSVGAIRTNFDDTVATMNVTVDNDALFTAEYIDQVISLKTAAGLDASGFVANNVPIKTNNADYVAVLTGLNLSNNRDNTKYFTGDTVSYTATGSNSKSGGANVTASGNVVWTSPSVVATSTVGSFDFDDVKDKTISNRLTMSGITKISNSTIGKTTYNGVDQTLSAVGNTVYTNTATVAIHKDSSASSRTFSSLLQFVVPSLARASTPGTFTSALPATTVVTSLSVINYPIFTQFVGQGGAPAAGDILKSVGGFDRSLVQSSGIRSTFEAINTSGTARIYWIAVRTAGLPTLSFETGTTRIGGLALAVTPLTEVRSLTLPVATPSDYVPESYTLYGFRVGASSTLFIRIT